VHARRIRPEAGHLDRRRLAAATLSAIVPGLGQFFNRRPQLGWLFLVPGLVILAVAVLLVTTRTPAQLAAWAITPSVLGTILVLNIMLMAWRLLSVGHAFLDTRWHGPTGRNGVIGIVILALVVALPHMAAWRYGTALGDTFDKVFSGNPPGTGSDDDPVESPAVTPDGRVNVLLVGVDTQVGLAEKGTLTDTMMVASLDPVGNTISIVSVPRDLVSVPLGNGDVFGPKINSLFGYAERHPDEFPDGGMRALQDALGALLGIEIPYYAKVDFVGFVDVINAVGGIDIEVDQGFSDPTYKGYQWPDAGFSITAGHHHMDGRTALAYARSRKALGESDFTRAGRQQQILVALRNTVTSDGSLLWELPGLLEAVGGMVSTNMPRSELPRLAAISDEIDDDGIVRAVIRHPLVASRSTQYGSSLVPNVKAIQEVAAALFPEPGDDPMPWPTPKPTPTPKATTTPSE
jgi:LCP family protein required for cell wall assembly